MEILKKQLLLNYQYTFEKNESNSKRIYLSGGIYFVDGFKDNIHFTESFKKFKEAKKYYKNKIN
jgi:hypothetical protein